MLALAACFVACNDDDSTENLNGTFGDAELYFDNGINGNDLALGTPYANSNGETLTINTLNYIISNVVFIKGDGTEYAYPKSDSYFVVNEETQQLTVHLEALPAGDYKKVRFGVGVDDSRYQQGQTAQQDFWNLAVANGLGTNWASGYRFIAMQGTFTSASVTNAAAFSVYQNGGNNYREITLNLPTTARVRHDISPSIHIKTNINLLLDGTNKVTLGTSLNTAGTQATVDTGNTLTKIADNTAAVFSVDHVHNESGDEHED